jgi:2,3-bisphosphoglycerate-independent phosphoglycerate mutase
MVFKGKGLSCAVSETDTEEAGVAPNKAKALDGKPESKRTADVLNKFTEKARKILEESNVNKARIAKGKLPANIVLARGAGMEPDITSFEQKYGIKGACVSATSLIMGVCRSIGMDVIEVKGANGHIDSDIGKKAAAAIEALHKYDFVFLHIKGTDEASHDGKFELKKKMLERIDKEVIGPILKKADLNNTTIVLTADHSTPLGLKQHSADPVPIAILGDVRTDDVTKYAERSCAKGGLSRICGRSLMGIVLDISNRAKLFGA